MERPRLVLAFALVGLAIPTQYLVNESALSGVFDLPLQIRTQPSKPWTVEATQLAERTEMDHTGAMRTARPDTRTALLATIPKLPTWIALAMLVCVCVLKVRTLRPDESSVSASAFVRRSCA
jgi:hypothetical protein